MRKLSISCILIIVIGLLLGLTACNNNDDNKTNNKEYVVKIYVLNESDNNTIINQTELTFYNKEINISEFAQFGGRIFIDSDCTLLAPDIIDISEQDFTLYIQVKQNSTEENDNGGKTEENPGEQTEHNPDENPNKQVSVNIFYLDSSQNVINNETRIYNEGQIINVSNFITEEGQKVYSSYYLSESDIIMDSIQAYEGLQLYIYKRNPMGTFTIYNVSDEGTSVYVQFEDYVGSKNYYGYSFEYLLYWDEGCKNPIDLNYEFELKEEGITVYRHIYQDYFVLNTKLYINDVLYQTTYGVYEKEKIHHAFGPYGTGIVNDYKTSFFDSNASFYYGDGKELEMTENSLIATSLNDYVVSIYAYSPEHHIYTLKIGDTVLTDEYITTFGEFDEFYYSEGMGHSFSYKNKLAEYCTVSGNIITMHKVTTLKGPLKVFVTWNGRILYEDSAYVDTYFLDTFTIFGPVGSSNTFYLDISCTTPIELKESSDGDGIYEITGSTTLYTPFIVY